MLQNEVDVFDPGVDEIEESAAIGHPITSYGADFTVDGLVQRLRRGEIRIPDFQRRFTWTIYRASRFIESLLLRLPVPSVFLARDSDKHLSVIDGQQRLLTVKRFYDGLWDDRTPFLLTGVQHAFEGKSYSTLTGNERSILDEAMIHAVVVQQDQPADDDSSIYEIFERLNTGGVQLTGQEIRSAVYRGSLIKLIRNLNTNADWRQMVGERNLKGLKDEEIILRFFAMFADGESYQRPMKGFLNRFASRHRMIGKDEEAEFRRRFEAVVEVIRHVRQRPFHPSGALNAAVVETVMTAVAKRLARGPVESLEDLRAAHDQLLRNPDYLKAVEQSTAAEESVRTRLSLAIQAFSNIR